MYTYVIILYSVNKELNWIELKSILNHKGKETSNWYKDNLLIRLATSRPLGERTEPFLTAKRPTASDEVMCNHQIQM